MAVPKEICCCGAYSWAKVIGVIQIIIYIGSLILSIFGLIFLGKAAAAVHEHSFNKYATAQATSNDRVVDFVCPFFLILIGIVFSIVGIVTAVLLIKGANQSNTKYLTIWMVFAAVCYGFKIIEVFISRDHIIVSIIGLSTGAAIYGFGIWTVFVLKREIRTGTFATWAAAPRGTTFPMIVKV